MDDINDIHEQNNFETSSQQVTTQHCHKRNQNTFVIILKHFIFSTFLFNQLTSCVSVQTSSNPYVLYLPVPCKCDIPVHTQRTSKMLTNTRLPRVQITWRPQNRMKCWIAPERSHQDSEFPQSNCTVTVEIYLCPATPMIWSIGREREGGYRVVREVKKKR